MITGQLDMDPKVYSDEEIGLFVQGGRREIDELLLTGYNSMVKAFLSFRDEEFRPHVEEEQKLKDELGTLDDIRIRRLWMDAQIKKEMDRAELRKKVLTSAVLWAVPILLAAFFGVMQDGFRERLSNWIAPTKMEQRK